MKFTITGRIHPERADVSIITEPWKWSLEQEEHSVLFWCESSQVVILADFPSMNSPQDALIVSNQVGKAILSSLGFALATGYDLELIQVISESGQIDTFGRRVQELMYDPVEEVFLACTQLSKKDVFFRHALRDYSDALTDELDCAFFCYRAVEGISNAFKKEFGGNGWDNMHTHLGTSAESIKTIIKSLADPNRHGNWKAFQPTTSSDRFEVLQLTRDILHSYLGWRNRVHSQASSGDPATT